MRRISGRTRATATVAAVSAALVLAGCGTADSNAQKSSSSKTPSPTSSSSTTSEQPAPTTSSSTSTSTSTSTTKTPTRTQTPTPTRTQTPTPTRTQTPTQTETRTPTKSATPSKSDDDTPLTDDGKPLTLGASSPRVLKAQKRLQSLGYYIPSPDGSFGGGTRQAVWALQKVAGLPRTGQIDSATMKALNQGVRGNPRVSNGLEVDLSRQVLYVVRGGTLLRTINVSSGNGENFKYPVKKDEDGKVTKWGTSKATTPAGSFKMYMSRDENWESTLELGSMYRPAYFNGGIAVHGSGSVPAYPASHGCIRVTNDTMNWLWSNGFNKTGTPVLVH